MRDDARAALARNDRYLLEFVEALGVCPFARHSREEGLLERRVLLGSDLDEESILTEIASLPVATEVALLIFPDCTASPEAFERMASRLRERHADPDGFFLVPFHPAMPVDVASPARAVSLMRRSPDPTIQLIRKSILDRVRGTREGETRWMDPADLDQPLPAPAAASVSERIAAENFDTVLRIGAERIVALLATMRT